MKDEAGVIYKMPAVFKKIKEHISQFKSVIQNTPSNILEEFWEQPISDNRALQWIQLVVREGRTKNDKELAKSVLKRLFLENGLL